MTEFEIEMTTHQATRMWASRTPFTIRVGDDVMSNMVVDQVIGHPSGWSTVRFRRIAAWYEA